MSDRPKISATLAPRRLDEVADRARWLETLGYHGVWVGEGRVRRDAVVVMTLAAASTSRLMVGSGILPARTRHPALLAMTFRTLAELAPDRVRLGLGAWWEPIASRMGLGTTHPVTAMREIATTVRDLLAGRTVTRHGEYVDVTEVAFDPGEHDLGWGARVPIFLGAVGPAMLKLSGEIADGVLLDFFVPPAYGRFALDHLKAGAVGAGRSLDQLQRPQLVACAIDDHEPDRAVQGCRTALTRYLAQQPHIAAYSGADPDLVQRLRSMISWPATPGEIEQASHLVPTSLVRSVCACGTTSEAMEAIEAYVDAGATEVVVAPFGSDAATTLERVAAVLGQQ